MTAFEVRHPQSQVPLQGVQRMIAGDILAANDWLSDKDGTWQQCPPERVGTCVDEYELTRGSVWARPISPSLPAAICAHLAPAQAGMGSMHRLW